MEKIVKIIWPDGSETLLTEVAADARSVCITCKDVQGAHGKHKVSFRILDGVVDLRFKQGM